MERNIKMVPRLIFSSAWETNGIKFSSFKISHTEVGKVEVISESKILGAWMSSPLEMDLGRWSMRIG